LRSLTAQEILFFHHHLIVETGGLHEVRDLGPLEAACLRPDARYREQAVFPGLFEKIAAMVDAIIRDHAFVDGNKRTGVGVAALLLSRNGFHLTATGDELGAFALSIAVDRPPRAQLASWLQSHSEGQ
jgi:death-on-curing protein